MTNYTKHKSNDQISIFTPKGPLPFRVRPQKIEDVIGHEALTEKNGILYKWLNAGVNFSIILWGPPGCGKTTIANLAKNYTEKEFVYLSGANTTVADLREVIKKASLSGKVILFIDEIHRLAKNQQDILLEPIESGHIILIGTTTENTHVSITKALHSRVKVIELSSLKSERIKHIINNALSHKNGYPELKIDDSLIDLISNFANGDVRKTLGLLEEICENTILKNQNQITKEIIEECIKNSQSQIGVDENAYYDYVSALQKSIRGSDPDASVYWLGRLLSGGADPLQVARRILVCASEDIGLADPNGLQIALNAYLASSFLGMPEARIPLSQAVIYLAYAKKSNASYKAINEVMNDIKNQPQYAVPMHLRNLGGKGYKYPHDYPNQHVEQDYLPEELKGKKYYFSS